VTALQGRVCRYACRTFADFKGHKVLGNEATDVGAEDSKEVHRTHEAVGHGLCVCVCVGVCGCVWVCVCGCVCGCGCMAVWLCV